VSIICRLAIVGLSRKSARPVLILLRRTFIHIYPDFGCRNTCLIFGMDPAALATLSPEEHAAFMEALLEGPALEPPPGVIPDFANPGGHHGIGYGIVILGATLTTIAVALRLYSRVAIKKVNIEDGTFNQCLYRRVLTFARPINLGVGMQVQFSRPSCENSNHHSLGPLRRTAVSHLRLFDISRD
jgi:hypothetical protein